MHVTTRSVFYSFALPEQLALSVFLLVVIILSAIFNFWQEWRSSQLMRKFK